MNKCRWLMAGLIAVAVCAHGQVLFDENFDAPGIRWQGTAVPGAGGILVHTGTTAASHLIVPVQMPAETGRIKVTLTACLAKGGTLGVGFSPSTKISDTLMNNYGQPWMNLFGINGGAVYAGPYASEKAGELEKNKLKMNELQTITFELIRNGTAWSYRVLNAEMMIAEGPIQVSVDKLKYFFIQFRAVDKNSSKNESSVDSVRLEVEVSQPLISG